MNASQQTVVICLASFLYTLPVFCQTGGSIDDANYPASQAIPLVHRQQTVAAPLSGDLVTDPAEPPDQGARQHQMFDLPADDSPATAADNPREGSSFQPSIEVSKPADFNREIYYRNKLEFSLDGGWHPINVPFPLDVFVGDAYNTYPLKYTLVPIFASLRWQVNNIGMPWILRGNWDVQFTGSITGVARGPESRYFAYLMGVRRNFVHRNWRVAPYFDTRLGVGSIDAKGPKGVLYAQGQNITFTMNIGSGVRYNFNSRYAISAGLNFMHISNLDLSESNGKPNWGVRNYGINVYGPMVGLDIQLRRRRRGPE